MSSSNFLSGKGVLLVAVAVEVEVVGPTFILVPVLSKTQDSF